MIRGQIVHYGDDLDDLGLVVEVDVRGSAAVLWLDGHMDEVSHAGVIEGHEDRVVAVDDDARERHGCIVRALLGKHQTIEDVPPERILTCVTGTPEELFALRAKVLDEQDLAADGSEDVVVMVCDFFECPLCIDDIRMCAVCGCTDDNPCEGGCWWVAEDLCSACEELTARERLATHIEACPDHCGGPNDGCDVGQALEAQAIAEEGS